MIITNLAKVDNIKKRSASNNRSMKAIIMAGGEGRRLKPVTGEHPKPMAPVLGKPLMERIIELLRSAGVSEVCASLRYKPREIMDYFGDGEKFGVHLQYRLESSPLGTAGGVKNCADFYGDEDFLVISGDAACSFDLKKLMAEHRERGPAVTMALYESPCPLRYGLVVPDSRGNVRCFIEKPGWERVVTNLVNTGVYVLSPRAMELVPEGEPYDFAKDLFPLLMERGEVIRGVPMEGYWCDVGTPEAYYQCCLDAIEGRFPIPDAPPEEPPPVNSVPDAPLKGESSVSRLFSCRDRARLMAAMSACMLELGADLSSGLTLSGQHCAVRVRPDPEKPALKIEASSPDPHFSRELLTMTENLARELEDC